MPEMFKYCGKRFPVFKRAHKTCDTVNDYKGRKMQNAVHLEGIRCDGQAHGGCEAACLIFWKEAWLKRPSGFAGSMSDSPTLVPKVLSCTEADVMAATQVVGGDSIEGPTYVCQATLLPSATEALPWWNLCQYIEDYTSGNVGLGRMVSGFIYMGYNSLVNAGIGLGRILRWLYDVSVPLRHGLPYPRRTGKIPVGQPTPTGRLDLQPGELVRVRTYKEILATLDESNKNRGLVFDAEMVPYCGTIRRVYKRVNRIINEKTGKMMDLKTASIILDGAICQARYSDNRFFCPRSIFAYWRESWLERVSPHQAGDPEDPATKVAG